MKLFLVSFFMLLSFAAHSSDELFIYEMNEADIAREYRIVYKEFEINEKLESAWVAITLIANRQAVNAYREVKVPGLFYDKTSSSILWDFQGQLIDCAHVIKRGRGVFRHTKIKMTGACGFREKITLVTLGDGGQVEKRQFFLVRK